MGFSQVAPAALILTGCTFGAFQILGQSFDAHETLDARWHEGTDLSNDLLHTELEVTGVASGGGTVTVDLRNTGSTTLDAGKLDVLLDGLPTTVDSWTVEGAASDVWPALTDAQLILTAAAPTDVLVATEHGVTAVWRA